MYTLTLNTGLVTRDSDGVVVAPVSDTTTQAHQDWLAWCALGNSPVEVPGEPDAAVLVAEYEAAIQNMLDAAAQAHGFDNIFTAATYAGSIVPQFDADGTALRNWRDQCWAASYQILAEVQGGQRSAPTVAELLAELPALGG